MHVLGRQPNRAVVGCPDGDAPILWQVAACRECLTDLIMTAFDAVKHSAPWRWLKT
jgi:hypothetical protein